MIVAQDPTALRHHLEPLRAHAERIAFVPTMGNLHAGHLALERKAQNMKGLCLFLMSFCKKLPRFLIAPQGIW